MYDDEDGTSNMRKRRIKKKKKVPGYREPSDKDLLMAKAYGGLARG